MRFQKDPDTCGQGLRTNMSIYRKKKDISKHLPRSFYLFGMKVDLEAIQFSYSLGIIKYSLLSF